MTDDNPIDVATNDRVVPDTGVIADGHIAQHRGAARYIYPLAQGGFFAEEPIELLVKRVHARRSCSMEGSSE